MTTICWTVIHHTAVPVAHGVSTAAKAARRFIGPAARRGAQSVHHSPTAAVHPRVWFELICKVVPAAVVGGGLLVPHPANPPLPPEPPALVQPAVPPAIPWGWQLPPTVAPGVATPGPVLAPPGTEGVSEPSTGRLMLAALGGLVLIRLAARLATRQEQHISPPPRATRAQL
jgi:hypothetical protein